jgi:hypothetical protein
VQLENSVTLDGMISSSRLAEVAEVDRFMGEQKYLSEGLPTWRESHISGWLTAEWPILDEDGVALEATRLVFSCKAEETSRLSVSVLLRGNRVFGVDLVPNSVCKMNGPRAQRLGLPSRVCGSHFHEWADNRDHALATRVGEMPHRRPTPKALSRLPHALMALAQAINLSLTTEQASFDVPPQGRLDLGR